MITHKIGNLLESDCNFICHQVNCQGVMGSGIAKQIRDKWPEVYDDYKSHYSAALENGWYLLGDCIGTCIKYDTVTKNKVYIIDFFSQDKYLPRNICHTNYQAFRTCCSKLHSTVKSMNIPNKKIGFPYKIGCGLAGGDWNTITTIIEEELGDLEVEIYKLSEDSE